MNELINDTQYLGLNYKHALTCCWCGAEMVEDMDFQAYHMNREHRLEC